MTVVFDFDKTLTNRDTHWQFMLLGGRTIFSKLIIHIRCIVFSLLYKVGAIDNDSYKYFTFSYAWHGSTMEEFYAGCREFGRSVRLGRSFPYLFAMQKRCDVYVVTASIGSAVAEALPSSVEVIGTTVTFCDGRVSGIGESCFGDRKVHRLRELGINNIDTLFTDSYSDEPLMDMSDNVYFVGQNFIKKIKGSGRLCGVGGGRY